MCIRLKRLYNTCGHEVEKIVRCALPYYWLNGRVDDVSVPPEPAGFFDRVEKVNPDDPGPTPYFGCFDCLDEIEERYTLGCPDCSGQGSVHSERDLLSRIGTISGSDNPAAYELMKQNYHRYLCDFLRNWPAHYSNLNRVHLFYTFKAQYSEVADDTPPPDNPLYRETMGEMGRDLWCGPDRMLFYLMDKMLAELKCRQETTHPPPDDAMDWQTKETHLAEHIPALNNISTDLRRTMALGIESSLRSWLGIITSPFIAPDVDDEGNSLMYDNQPFNDVAEEYSAYAGSFRSDDIVGPYNPGKGPYDILEFVPQWPRQAVDNRMNQLQNDLLDEMTRAEIEAPRGDVTIRGGRAPDVYARHEDFITHTIGFIFQLLALDPGLSDDRMIEIGRLFHSLLMEPWYDMYGHPGKGSILEREVGSLPQGHETSNSEFRGIIQDYVDVESTAGSQLPPSLNWWWEKLSYRGLVAENHSQPNVNLTWDRAHAGATSIWESFYKNWLQILANVELSHTKLTQQQLNDQADQNCPVCGDQYDLNHEFNCPVYYGCPNNHVLDKKCYTVLSLTPTKPYNRLRSDRFCPLCRAVIPYDEALHTNLLADARFMPSLNITLDPNSFSA